MKKITSLLVVLAMLVSMFTVLAAADDPTPATPPALELEGEGTVENLTL